MRRRRKPRVSSGALRPSRSSFATDEECRRGDQVSVVLEDFTESVNSQQILVGQLDKQSKSRQKGTADVDSEKIYDIPVAVKACDLMIWRPWRPWEKCNTSSVEAEVKDVAKESMSENDHQPVKVSSALVDLEETASESSDDHMHVVFGERFNFGHDFSEFYKMHWDWDKVTNRIASPEPTLSTDSAKSWIEDSIKFSADVLPDLVALNRDEEDQTEANSPFLLSPVTYSVEINRDPNEIANTTATPTLTEKNLESNKFSVEQILRIGTDYETGSNESGSTVFSWFEPSTAVSLDFEADLIFNQNLFASNKSLPELQGLTREDFESHPDRFLSFKDQREVLKKALSSVDKVRDVDRYKKLKREWKKLTKIGQQSMKEISYDSPLR